MIICDKINEMNVQEILLSKNGMAIVKIAEILLSAEIGEKIPTVAELTKSTGLAKIIKDLDKPIEGCDVLLIEDENDELYKNFAIFR